MTLVLIILIGVLIILFSARMNECNIIVSRLQNELLWREEIIKELRFETRLNSDLEDKYNKLTRRYTRLKKEGGVLHGKGFN